jgi:hypothetical protein
MLSDGTTCLLFQLLYIKATEKIDLLELPHQIDRFETKIRAYSIVGVSPTVTKQLWSRALPPFCAMKVDTFYCILATDELILALSFLLHEGIEGFRAYFLSRRDKLLLEMLSAAIFNPSEAKAPSGCHLLEGPGLLDGNLETNITDVRILPDRNSLGMEFLSKQRQVQIS